jgi:DUF971 family protein
MTANEGEHKATEDTERMRPAADVSENAHAAPRAIVLHAASRVLELDWGDDVRHAVVQRIPTAVLRASCPCSACEKQRINGVRTSEMPDASDASDVSDASAVTTVTAVELVGAYALNIRFADGHDRGIYPWSYLRGLTTKSAA